VLTIEERALLGGIEAILAKQVHIRLGTVPLVEGVRNEIDSGSHDEQPGSLTITKNVHKALILNSFKGISGF
jgi:hypothetical protein